jgi:hypothetical protein
MIVALLGYVGTMLVAFVVLVMAWHHVLGPAQMEKVQQVPRPIGAVARDAGPAPQPGTIQPGGTLADGTWAGGTWGPRVVHKADDRSDTAGADDAATAAAKQAAEAEKARRQRQARNQKRKEQLARQQQDQQYSTALGYDQERPQGFSSGQSSSGQVSPGSGPLFNLFGPRRF